MASTATYMGHPLNAGRIIADIGPICQAQRNMLQIGRFIRLPTGAVFEIGYFAEASSANFTSKEYFAGPPSASANAAASTVSSKNEPLSPPCGHRESNPNLRRATSLKIGTASGIRTRVTAVKGRCPRPG